MAFLSQASHLGSLLLPHDAFQEYAAHPAEWSAALNSKGSERTCIRSGLATFLHCACTAHPDFVVDRWTSDGESSSHRHFLFRQAVWTMFRRQISKEIALTISMAWHFTTKSGGIWLLYRGSITLYVSCDTEVMVWHWSRFRSARMRRPWKPWGGL